ncbi:MAG: hypothetical protein U0822_05785 [Anaerolineae bacterium]
MKLSGARLVRLFLGIAGALLLLQGSASLVRVALAIPVPELVLDFTNADPLHATIHIIWGIVMLLALVLPVSERARALLVLVFGVFYTVLAFLGTLVYHPFGLQLGLGENVFHFVVGPLALIVAYIGLRQGVSDAKGVAGGGLGDD